MRTFKNPRRGSYEGNLTLEEREQLYGWLLEPGLPVAEVVNQARPWQGGRGKDRSRTATHCRRSDSG
jgi:hypothetical protein